MNLLKKFEGSLASFSGQFFYNSYLDFSNSAEDDFPLELYTFFTFRLFGRVKLSFQCLRLSKSECIVLNDREATISHAKKTKFDFHVPNISK